MLLLTLLLTLPLAESESESGLVAASSLVGVVAMSFSDLEAWREVLRKETNVNPVFRNCYCFNADSDPALYLNGSRLCNYTRS